MGSSSAVPDESSDDSRFRRSGEAEESGESVPNSTEADAAQQERRIDALVQRVAAAKAARITEPADDPIEATIRRVAEAKAAREAADSGADAPVNEKASGPPDASDGDRSVASVPEDAIEATIRRVAEAKAAREAAGGASELDEDAGSDTSLPENRSGVDPAPHVVAYDHESAVASLEEPDEDPIDAAIRRVAAAKAAQDAAAESESTQADDETDTPAPSEPTWEPVRTAPPPTLTGRIIAPPAWRTPSPGAAAKGTEEPEPDLRQLVAELRRDLDATRAALAALTARYDALPPAAVSSDVARSSIPASSVVASDDDDWDDSPSVPRFPLSQPPRPAIFRDPPAGAAVPEPPAALQEDDAQEDIVIDTRPLPKPLPPIHAEPRRGLDLLPRTYRVTVEDKRRGVDLVPLHRALLGMDGVRDMSLLSYSSGVAIVSLDTVDELDPDALCSAIGRAMSCPARVEVHNEQTMVVKLAED